MKIVIEGCDGTGKTTLATKLAEAYHLDICHVTNRDSNTFAFYQELIGKEDIVWDRNMIGEIIYPRVFNRKANLDDLDLEYLLKRGQSTGMKFIVLTASNEEIRARLNSRGEPHQCVLDNIEFINDNFIHLARKHHLCLIDTTGKTFKEIFDEANKYIKGE